MNFESLGLSAPILKALKACDYQQPTPIQSQAIPPALAGRDVLGCAQTGTGKTCAFGTPILQRLSTNPKKRGPIRALILTPTRELALQIGENLQAYAKGLPLSSTVIFGGVGQNPQVERLKRGVEILTATPGRLLDLHNQGLLKLDQVEIFVLDEADRMLDMGFLNDVRKIIALLPKKKQTLFFSATMPEEITELVNTLMDDPVRIEVNPVSSPVEAIRQQVYLLDRKNKTKLLADILREDGVKNALVFTRTKHGADKVTRDLLKENIKAAAIHGNKSQTARQQALFQFKKGQIQVLVATDIAARGLDIEELSHVFNYNLPEVPETYVHRIGRTGRAGRGGIAISFCDHAEEPLLRSIEKLIGRQVPRVDGHPYPMEDFEKMRRDAKGRLVHPDDEEARRSAREKRKTAVPSAKAQREPSVQAEERKPPSRAKRPKQEAKKPNPAPAPKPVQQAPQAGHPDPLKGEIIMDATARLLASKPLHKPAPHFENPEKAERTTRRRRAPQGTKKPQEAPRQEGKKGTESKKPQRRMPQQPQKKREEAEKSLPTAAGSKEGKEPKQKPQNTKPRGRVARQAPPVHGLRSRQKDSTEQPSLMKPFYIEHD